MARIVIKDLHESIELDQKAMKNIRGGARSTLGARSISIYSARGQRLRSSPPHLFSNK